MNDNVLCIDDDPSILAAFQRALHRRFPLDIAIGGEAGLAALERKTYAVAISDLRMPGMDGNALFARIRERWPDTVRVMLTGANDISATIEAVNAGNLFRFLTKPCRSEDLAITIDAAIAQHHMVVAERELLEKTLSGSVKVLTEILSIISPETFGRSLRAKRYARHMAERTCVKSRWQVELAAMLSQIGCFALPGDILDRLVGHQPMSPGDQAIADGRHRIAGKLIAHIPRLEASARMIELQEAMGGAGPWPDDPCLPGAVIVYIAMEIENRLSAGHAPRAALGELAHRLDRRFADPLRAMDDFVFDQVMMVERVLLSRQLALGMVIAEDVRTKSGLLLVSRGQEATQVVIERLMNYAQQAGIIEPFRVLMPVP